MQASTVADDFTLQPALPPGAQDVLPPGIDTLATAEDDVIVDGSNSNSTSTTRISNKSSKLVSTFVALSALG